MRSRSWVAALVVLVALGGCASTVDAGSSTSPPAPVITPTPSPTPSVPVSAFTVTCDDILPLPSLQALVDGDLLPQPLTLGLGSNDATVVQDSGLSCHWRSDVTGAQVRAVALLDATDGFDQAKHDYETWEYAYSAYAALPMADGAFGQCRDGHVTLDYSCDWTVLAGNVWFSVAMDYLSESEVVIPVPRENPDTSSKPLSPQPQGTASELVAAAAAMLAASAVNVSPGSWSTPACDALVDAGSVAAAAGVAEVVVTDSNDGRVMQQNGLAPWGMYRYSADRVGSRTCSVQFGEDTYVSFRVSPGAAWTLDQTTTYSYPVPAFGTHSTGCTPPSHDGVSCGLTFVDTEGVLVLERDGGADQEGYLPLLFESVRSTLGW